MRNEIFQQIKKNREMFFSELKTKTVLSENDQVTPFQSQEIPKKKLDSDKLKDIVSQVRIKLVGLDEVIKPWFRSVFRLKKRMTTHTRRINQRINDEADRIKLQMADFLLLLFSDEEMAFATAHSETKNRPSSVSGSGQSPRDISSATREIIFYLTSKPALSWGNLLQKSFSGISSKPHLYRPTQKRLQDFTYYLRLNQLIQRNFLSFLDLVNKIHRFLRLPIQTLLMNPVRKFG